MIKHKFRLFREEPSGGMLYRWRCTVCEYWFGVGKTYFRAVLTVPELAGRKPWSMHKLENLIPQCRLPYDGGNQP